MDLRDATLMILMILMILTESAAYPDLQARVQAAYDEMIRGQQVSHEVLSEILGEASGKGVLRAIQQKYSAAAHEAVMMPLFMEIDRQRPVGR